MAARRRRTRASASSWRAATAPLSSCATAGAIKAIGGGINEWQVAEAMARQGDFDLFLLAGRYTLLEQEALDSFLPLCAQRGIGIVLGGPYNSGILATGPRPGAFYNYDPAPPEILERVGRHAEGLPVARRGAGGGGARLPARRIPPSSASSPAASGRTRCGATPPTCACAIPASLWSDLKAEGLMRRGRARSRLTGPAPPAYGLRRTSSAGRNPAGGSPP